MRTSFSRRGERKRVDLSKGKVFAQAGVGMSIGGGTRIFLSRSGNHSESHYEDPIKNIPRSLLRRITLKDKINAFGQDLKLNVR